MLSSTAIVGASILESGSNELLARIEAVKTRVNNIGTDEEYNNCKAEIQSLLELIEAVRATRDKAAKKNPDYLKDLDAKNFPNARYVFINIDNLHTTCINLQSSMEWIVTSIVRSAPRSTAAKLKHTHPQEKKNVVSHTERKNDEDSVFRIVR